MKQTLYIVLAILISSCGQRGEDSNVQTQKDSNIIYNHSGIFSMSEIPKAYFNKTDQIRKVPLIIDSTSIKKNKGILRLPINSDKFSELIYKDKVNPNNEEADITYLYLGYYRPISKYLIETDYYESVDFDLISKDGWKTSIWNKPIFSNDAKYFACIKPYRLEGEPVGIQIWKVKIDPIKSRDTVLFDKIFELNQLFFNPIDCHWDIDGSLLIKAEKMRDDLYPKNPSEMYYLKLKFN